MLFQRNSFACTLILLLVAQGCTNGESEATTVPTALVEAALCDWPGKKAKQKLGWTFTEDAFTIEGSPVPGDLHDATIGEGMAAYRIDGTWKIEGNELYLYSLIPESGTKVESKLKISGTKHIRIETEKEHYLFESK